MDYLNKKNEWLKELSDLLLNLNDLHDSSNAVVNKMRELLNCSLVDDIIEFSNSVMVSDDYDMFMRLYICLQYIKNPNDPNIIASLEENISLYKNVKKHK